MGHGKTQEQFHRSMNNGEEEDFMAVEIMMWSGMTWNDVHLRDLEFKIIFAFCGTFDIHSETKQLRERLDMALCAAHLQLRCPTETES